jgi:hypothetical protein
MLSGLAVVTRPGVNQVFTCLSPVLRAKDIYPIQFTPMTEKTFAELFCEKHGLSAEKYERVVVGRALYPHARLLAPLVAFLWPQHFAADLDFVRSVARLRRYREFFFESEEFAHHPANRGFWRLTAHIRISSRKLRRMVRTTLHQELDVEGDDSSAVPFRIGSEGAESVMPKESKRAAS